MLSLVRRRGLLLLSMAMACTRTNEGATPSKAAKADASPKAKEAEVEKKAKSDEPKADAKADAKAAEKKSDDAKADDPKAQAEEPEAPKPEEPAPEPESSPTRALLLVDGKLLRLAPSGKTEVVAEAPGATECDFDESHRVVWLISDKSISAYDPADGALHRIADGLAAPDDYGVSWQVQRDGHTKDYGIMTAGNVDGIDACVALVVAVGKSPSVGGAIIAEGDREWYCFEDDDSVGEDRSKQVLNSDEAAIKAAYDGAKLVDAKYLSTLAARWTKDGPLVRPKPKAPPTPKPKVDRSQCEENPEDCGTAEYIGGGRLWRVVTYNSRGDFYHESHHIYDSKTSSWWDPATETRTPTPAEDGESGINASPDGVWGLYDDKVFSLTEARSTGTFKGSLCGWE